MNEVEVIAALLPDDPEHNILELKACVLAAQMLGGGVVIIPAGDWPLPRDSGEVGE